MIRSRRRATLIILAGLGMGLLAVALFSLVVINVVKIPVPNRFELAAARARWERRTFDAYTIRVSGHDGIDLCPASDYTVRDEQVVPYGDLPPQSCGTYTVTDLFQRVADFEPKCGPNGCACDGAQTMDVTYDPTLGYPTSIYIRLDPSLRTRYASYWLGQMPLVGRRGCTLIGYIGYEIRVLSLMPLP